MLYVATVILFLMCIGLFACGILLWKRRLETGDYSRHIQAVFSVVSAFFAFIFIFRTWAGSTTVDSAFFDPEHVFVPVLIQMAYFFYPLEVIKPLAKRTTVYAFLFLPLFVLIIVGLCAGLEYTSIYSYADLWQHIGRFNVWFRLFTLVAMFFYAFSLFLVPYDWRHSSADRKFILRYASGFCLIGLLYFAIQVSHAYIFVLLHQVAWMAFFFWVAWYELKERLLPVSTPLVPEKNSDEDKLWQKIVNLMDEEEGWFNPEISQAYLAEKLFSNRTYIGEAFKRNTGMTFRDYQTKRRINYVVEQLKLNPHADIRELFFRMGYRDRSTAWRNFRKMTGMSPTEFIETLK